MGRGLLDNPGWLKSFDASGGGSTYYGLNYDNGFPPTNDRIDGIAEPSLNVATKVSWSFFMYQYGFINAGNVHHKIFQHYKGVTAYEYISLRSTTPPRLYLILVVPAGYIQCYIFYADAGLAFNTWYHIYIEFDGDGATNSDKFRLWVNGVEKPFSFNFNTVITALATSDTTPILWGQSVFASPDSGNSFYGILTQIRLFNDVKGDNSRALELYNGGAGYATHYSDAHGVVEYLCTEQADYTVADTSEAGVDNTGTLVDPGAIPGRRPCPDWITGTLL